MECVEKGEDQHLNKCSDLSGIINEIQLESLIQLPSLVPPDWLIVSIYYLLELIIYFPTLEKVLDLFNSPFQSNQAALIELVKGSSDFV